MFKSKHLMIYSAATDPARFQGNGISYRAKLIGIEDVTEARGDKLCQETIQKLKAGVRISGQHKQRIFVNVTLEGLRIYDAVSMTLLYTHPVHQISFISRDVTDSRAFGYIFGPGDGTHRFFGIKTASAAENLVLALRDLFQTVYEMKKKEMEEAKAKAAAGTQENQEGEADNPDTTYQVPPNGAPVEGQDNIYQGIEQIKNLDFDDLPEEEAPRKATSATTSPTTTDPWGAPATPASGTSSMPTSSSLSDLQTLQAPPVSNPFSTMQAFPGTPAPAVGVTAQGGPFAMGPPGGMGFMAPGQQASRELQPQVQSQPISRACHSVRGLALEILSLCQPQGPSQGRLSLGLWLRLGCSNASGPLKPGGQEEEAEAPKSPRPPLFEDLVDIKKTSGAASAAKSPKEMFKQLNAPPKKSLNEIKAEAQTSPICFLIIRFLYQFSLTYLICSYPGLSTGAPAAFISQAATTHSIFTSCFQHWCIERCALRSGHQPAGTL
nr:hypothetical protein BaRGS_032605 [Batillaria attramentaria]